MPSQDDLARKSLVSFCGDLGEQAGVNSTSRANHLSLSNATLQLCNLSQNCILVGQNVVHLLRNLLLSNKQQEQPC